LEKQKQRGNRYDQPQSRQHQYSAFLARLGLWWPHRWKTCRSSERRFFPILVRRSGYGIRRSIKHIGV
jgi:hypothetical protein